MNVEPIPLSECNATMLNFNQIAQHPSLLNGISDSQYCAKDAANGPCQGDAGAPLQLRPSIPGAPAKIVAIVSCGTKCGSAVPSIYTRISSYVDWIEQVVWPNDLMGETN